MAEMDQRMGHIRLGPMVPCDTWGIPDRGLEGTVVLSKDDEESLKYLVHGVGCI